MPSSVFGWHVVTAITEQSSCEPGLIFVQNVNGSPHNGMGTANKLHEAIVTRFADNVGARASSQGDMKQINKYRA